MPMPWESSTIPIHCENNAGKIVLSQSTDHGKRVCLEATLKRNPHDTIRRIDPNHHTYLRSVSGFNVTADGEGIVGTISHPSPLKLPACVDQIFPYLVQKDFGMLMGPTIAMKVSPRSEMDWESPLVIRQSEPCSMHKSKKGDLIGIVKMTLFQGENEVGTSEVTCLLKPAILKVIVCGND
jgi:hypothetical protein